MVKNEHILDRHGKKQSVERAQRKSWSVQQKSDGGSGLDVARPVNER